MLLLRPLVAGRGNHQLCPWLVNRLSGFLQRTVQRDDLEESERPAALYFEQRLTLGANPEGWYLGVTFCFALCAYLSSFHGTGSRCNEESYWPVGKWVTLGMGCGATLLLAIRAGLAGETPRFRLCRLAC